ncbi:MAG: aldehyde dehydrogenase family protein [Streptosporangiaceae bacterium]
MTVTEAPVQVLPDTGLLIADRRIHDPSGGVHRHVYAGTGRQTAEVPLGGAREMDEAVAAARQAQARWQAMPADRRRDLMLRLAGLIKVNAERLTAMQILEAAVPRRFAGSFPNAAADFLAYNAGWADKLGGEVVGSWPARALDYTLDEPFGVVAVIIPWNGPLAAIGQLLGPVLAAGNAAVIKPPELAPFTSLCVGELILEAGFPPGLVNVVPGGAEGGTALARHPGVDKIHFTGSPATARKVLAAAQQNLTPVGLELGGKSAHLIFADADIKAAARQALSGAVVLSGQGCVNGTRVLAEAPVYDEVLRLMESGLRRITVGDPFAQGTWMGPLVTEAACERVMRVIEHASAAGHGRLIVGGERLGGELAAGYFISPAVFADVVHGSDLAQQEIFGPVLSVMKFENEKHAIELANDTRYGLGGYVHTTDLRRAHRVSKALAVGNVWVNGFYGISPAMPFGGIKQSGHGRLGGRAGIREFTRPKNIWIAM